MLFVNNPIQLALTENLTHYGYLLFAKYIAAVSQFQSIHYFEIVCHYYHTPFYILGSHFKAQASFARYI